MMTNQRFPDRVRLEEIQRIAGAADAEEQAAEAAKASKRRMFGPLFYSTLVIAAVVTLIVGAIRVLELVEGETTGRREASPGEAVAQGVQQLGNAKPEIRAAAAKGLGDVLMRIGSGAEDLGFRAQAILALRMALADNDVSVRVNAANALRLSAQFARSAKAELTVALNDQDLTVRVAAARALLTLNDDSTVPALRALSELIVDPMLADDRRQIVAVMISAGRAGSDAAVASLRGMLSSQDELLRSEALTSISALGPEIRRLQPTLELFFKDDDPEVRYSAILAAVQATPADQTPAPRLISGLEHAVTDASLTIGLRRQALEELYTRSQESLTRCGRELGRQLENPDFDVRLAAATLLHMIDDETLAGKNVPVTGP